MTRVAGVDGCRGGWAVAVIEVELNAPADLATDDVAANRLNPASAPIRLRHRSFDVIRHLSDLIADPDLAVICIDIPIGLPGPSGTRACDIQARHLLTPHGARVFAAPVRPTLDHIDDYRAACAISREVCGRALSKQAWHILGKIAEADAVATDPRLSECHPEVSFALLQGGTPITATKRSASGRAQRVALLSDVIERLPITDLPRGDDHLDALACAWSAARVVAGRAMTLPTDPGIRGDRGLDSAGRRMRIVG